ncbi:hypothetical protein KSX_19410 [Ktedonospora formicarum]|uniref:Glycosyltransferase RgtA/B/C/D-like domain-containing protein n=1 Tax=Ktedonospora formicarum TaxID=2778364 RepID=A0A8J3HZC6_9CHLR|nr:hypothetical protein KSX_19410 [Ktedonospora formicarum]
MLALVILASLIRFLLIAYHWPTTNSDEGVIDLMALHIAYRGEHPIFYYGQAYLGSLEAHLAAPFVLLFGPSVFSVRLLLIALYALFLVLLYNLASRLYTRKLALFSVLLLSFGSLDMILQQLKAFGRYPDILVLNTLLLLLASHLALTSPLASPAPRRWGLFFLMGLLSGIAIWTDQITLPFVGCALLLLALFCRRELRGWGLGLLLVGLLIGIGPMIYANLTSPLGNNSLNAILNVNGAMANEMAAKNIPSVRRFVGSLLFALPAATGFNQLCSPNQLPLFGPATPTMLACTLTHGLWSLGYLGLGGIATTQALISAWRLRPRETTLTELAPSDYRHLVIECTRLALLLSAGSILALYTLSASAAVNPGPTSRYLFSMCLALPALLWPLWRGLLPLTWPTLWRARALFTLRIATLLFILSMLVVGTVRTFEDVPNAQETFQKQENLINYLLSHKKTRIYSDYWTCNRLIFQTTEQIACSVLDEQLQSGQNRYPLYTEEVQKATAPAYVFIQDSAQARAFESQTYLPHALLYQRATVSGYIIYIKSCKVCST